MTAEQDNLAHPERSAPAHPERRAEGPESRDPSASVPRPRLQRIALCALSGALGAAAFPLAFPFTDGRELLASGLLEPLAFVCLVPVLLATQGQTPKRSFGTGFIAGMFFFTGAFWWVNVAMTTFGGMPNFLSVPALLALAGWCAFHWGLALGVTRSLELRHGWPASAVFAPVWVATELLRNYLFTGFPWANLGYSQMRNLWLSQVGSLLGVYGVAALVAFVNAALYEAWRWRVQRVRPMPRAMLAGAAAALVVGHAYGAARVWAVDRALEAAPKVQVAVVQGNIDQKLKSAQGRYAQMVLDAYNPATAAADASGADLIVWPEASFPLAMPVSNRDMRNKFLSKPSYRATLVLGVDLYDPTVRGVGENAAYVVNSALDVTAKYTKYHLVPFGEYVLFDLDKLLPIDNLVPGTFRHGTELPALPFHAASLGGRETKLGLQICYDALFPEIGRAYARAGAEILVNLTNDAWYGLSSAPHQFLRIVAMRAVETGLPIARSANTGISGFIDPAGRLQHTTSLGIVKADTNVVDSSRRIPSEWRMAGVPVARIFTPYVVIGDVPAYLAAAFSVAGIGWAFWKKRRESKAT